MLNPLEEIYGVQDDLSPWRQSFDRGMSEPGNPLEEMYWGTSTAPVMVDTAPPPPPQPEAPENPLEIMYATPPYPLEEFVRQAEETVMRENPISRALQNTLRTTGGAIMKAIEPLDRPRSMIVAALGDRPKGAVWEAAKGNIHPSYGELMPDEIYLPRANRGGFTGMQETPERTNIKPYLAFVADVLGDPLMYLQVGKLTKLGKKGKILDNLVKAHGDQLKVVLNTDDMANVFEAIRTGAPDAVNYLKGKGVKDATIKVAKGATDALYSTLIDQARAGQWTAAKWGPFSTPRGFNVGVAKGVQKGKEALPNIPIVNKFVTGTGDDVFDETVRELDRTHRRKVGDIMDYHREAKGLAPEVLGTLNEGSTMGWYERGGQGPLADITTRLQTGQLDEMGELANRGFGIGVTPIEEAGYRYAPHVKEPVPMMQRIKDSFRRKPTTYTPRKLHRDIAWIQDPLTGDEFIDSVSRFAKENKIDPADLLTRQASVDEIAREFGEQFFTGDLPGAVATGALENERALHGARQLEFYTSQAKEALENVGGVEEALAQGWRTPRIKGPDRTLIKDGKSFPLRSKIDSLAEIPMPAGKARFIEARFKEIVNPELASQQLKNLFTGYTSLWKRYTLFPFMEYHFRNMVGDLWNGWMQGWSPTQMPGDLMTAARMQVSDKPLFGFGAGKFTLKGTGVYGDIPSDVLYKKAQEYGVVGTGQYGEVVKHGLEKLKSEKAGFLKRELWDLNSAIEIGSFLEDNRRLALFARRLKEGDTFSQAWKVVTKALYDYNDLTEFEKGIRRWAVPFYTWYRKNIPAQLENIIRHPGKVMVLPKIKAAVEGTSKRDVPEELRPEWMRREFSIHTGTTPQGHENFAVMGNFIPTADLFKFGGSAGDFLTSALSNVNPAWKVPVEMMMNRAAFFDRPVDMLRDDDKEFWERGGTLLGNERTNYLGMNLPTSAVKLSEMLPFTRLLSTFDRLNPFGIFDEGEGYDPPGLREGQEKTRPYHTEMEPGQKALKAITGLKIYPSDIDRQMVFTLRDLERGDQRVPGLTRKNLLSAIRKAAMEGDQESVDRYTELFNRLEEKIREQVALYEQYEESKE